MIKNFKRIKEAGDSFGVRDFFTKSVLAAHFNDEELSDIKAFVTNAPGDLVVHPVLPKKGKQSLLTVFDGAAVYEISIEFLDGYERQGWIGKVEVDGNPVDSYLSTTLFSLLD